MRSRVVVLIVALLFGALAMFAAARYLDSARLRIEADAAPIEVLVAQDDLTVGATSDQLLEQGLIATETIPRQFVADSAVSSPAAISDQVLAFPVARGEQITGERFRYPAEVGLSYAVPKDYVAISIANNAVKGVSGLVKPGDHVMVMATFEPSGDLTEVTTNVILRKARVIAVGTDISTAETGSTTGAPSEEDEGGGGVLRGGGDAQQQTTAVPGTLTLALAPAEAEKLVFAEENGRVWLALIGSTTAEVPETPGMTFPRVIE